MTVKELLDLMENGGKISFYFRNETNKTKVYFQNKYEVYANKKWTLLNKKIKTYGFHFNNGSMRCNIVLERI